MLYSLSYLSGTGGELFVCGIAPGLCPGKGPPRPIPGGPAPRPLFGGMPRIGGRGPPLPIGFGGMNCAAGGFACCYCYSSAGGFCCSAAGSSCYFGGSSFSLIGSSDFSLGGFSSSFSGNFSSSYLTSFFGSGAGCSELSAFSGSEATGGLKAGMLGGRPMGGAPRPRPINPGGPPRPRGLGPAIPLPLAIPGGPPRPMPGGPALAYALELRYSSEHTCSTVTVAIFKSCRVYAYLGP